jgi:hypothetical protein
MPTGKETQRFEFEVAKKTPVIVCQKVKAGAAVLEVAHDEDGHWQFLCGGDHADGGSDGATTMKLAELVATDDSLNDLADLACNETAARKRRGAAWKRHDGTEDAIRQAIEEHGWFVAKIPPGESEAEPPFAYTIGLHKQFGHPELIIVGLPLDTMHAILNACGELVRSGEKLPVDVLVAEILEDYSVRFRTVNERKSYDEHVGYAIWWNEGREFPLLQLVWPDPEGRFPGEKGAAAIVKKQQPMLP